MIETELGDPLTDRQREVLRFLRRRMVEHGRPPTIREIADEFGVNVNAVMGHPNALRKKGVVTRGGSGDSRGWRPVVGPGACPCCGRPMEDVA